MKTVVLSGGVAVLIATSGVALAQTEQSAEQRQEQQQQGQEYERGRLGGAEDVQSVLEQWPEKQRKTAQELIRKYGNPEGVTDQMLVWRKNGPWEKTVLFREAVPHNFPMPHQDYVEQFTKLDVPPDKFDELAEFDGSVYPDRTKGVISARCDKEPMNILALNLANDIVQGKRSVEDARDFYAKTAKDFMQGKTSPYVEKLRFSAEGKTGDPDKAIAEKPGS
ncbi:hypothetical protein [Tautonia sociabilis]|uniref:Uncharacterized protein n=1 Tax=Tautonia sociabilis TaxID=2080755 RepID=A0A432ML10_9BACT|nr:hypothetical protein [Tautonia sociabilis]RUL87960.1 hypothetical protein TsocGM_09555 [Tautonia sociabilis]